VFLRTHPTRRVGVNWAIWAVALLMAISIGGGLTNQPTASGGTETAAPGVADSPPLERSENQHRIEPELAPRSASGHGAECKPLDDGPCSTAAPANGRPAGDDPSTAAAGGNPDPTTAKSGSAARESADLQCVGV
jgi:hypothetical protein